MKVLWVSNHPEAPTGYGTQTRQAVPRIAAMGHDVDILAFWGQEGFIGEWRGHTVYPKAFHAYGADMTKFWASKNQYDVIITLIDAWVMPGAELSALSHWAPWFPIDCDGVPDRVLEQVRFADTPLVFTRHAEAAMLAAGLSPTYVPHAIEPGFRVLDENDSREYLDLPRDAFVFGYVMANKGDPPRKAWDRHFWALGQMMKRHDDVCAFVHTYPGVQMSGVDIPRILHQYGIPPARVNFCDPNRFVAGDYSQDDMARLYNGIDVLMNASNGEGFGIPIVEAQMCGTPVIAGGWTAMPELVCSGDVIPVERSESIPTPVGGIMHAAHGGAILDAMEAMYQAAPMDRERVREKVMHYDADAVAERFWRPALDGIERTRNHDPRLEVLA